MNTNLTPLGSRLLCRVTLAALIFNSSLGFAQTLPAPAVPAPTGPAAKAQKPPVAAVFEESLFDSPFIHPQRDCITEGMVNPGGKEFRYLFSRDCRVVYVLPPAVMGQAIKSQVINADRCEELKNLQNDITGRSKSISEIDKKIRSLIDQLLQEPSKSESAKIDKEIQDLETRKQQLEVRQKQGRTFRDDYFSQIPGAIFSITVEGGVSDSELGQIRSHNHNTLNRRQEYITEVKDTAGNVMSTTRTEKIIVSSLQKAPVNNSLYMFNYKKPEDSTKNGGVIEVDVPGYEVLAQPEGLSGTVIFRTNGAVSATLKMALTTTCARTYIGSDGVPKLDETGADPFFAIARNFDVQKTFGQGYTASLNVDKVVTQITNFSLKHTEQGFKKSSVFEPTLNANISEIMTFNWENEYNNGEKTSLAEIQEVKRAVAASMIDDYIEKLVQEKLITIQTEPKVDPVTGGYVDESRTGHRCWSERSGGFLRRSRTRCGDYQYIVKVWKDGLTNEEVKRQLTLNGATTDSMSVYQKAPFTYSTVFVK